MCYCEILNGAINSFNLSQLSSFAMPQQVPSKSNNCRPITPQPPPLGYTFNTNIQKIMLRIIVWFVLSTCIAKRSF